MAQQEEGWPLGLQPFNERVGLARNRNLSVSHSFDTSLTGSQVSSTDSSSDHRTESTDSFFGGRRITLGHLIGLSSILELSRRSISGRGSVPVQHKKIHKRRIWFLSLCSKLGTDGFSTSNAVLSLGHFLQPERRAANGNPCSGVNDFDPNEGHAGSPQSVGDGNLCRELLSCLCGNLAR